MSEISTKDMIDWLDDAILYYTANAKFKSCTKAEKDSYYKSSKTTQAIRDFIQKHSDPDMVLVPLEPTDVMLNAGGRCRGPDSGETFISFAGCVVAKRVYKAMIKTANE